MPSQTFALEQGGPKRLEISWKAFWKEITIRMDGSLVGVIPGQKELREGQQFRLPDGSDLHIQLIQGLTSELRVLRDGKPLPGSGSDPRIRLRQAYGVLYFVGGISLLVGLAASLFQWELMLEIGFNWVTAIVGAIFLVLAFFVQRRSLAALWAAVILYGADIILSVFGGNFTVANLLVRVVFLVMMIGGFRAIKELKAESSPAN